MSFFLVFNTLTLIPLHQNLFSKLSFYHLTLWQLQFAHLSLVAVNFAISIFLKRKNAIEYLGQVNMLALISILLLSPLMLVNNIIYVKEFLSIAYLTLLTSFVIKEYFRRMKYANVVAKNKPIIIINLICLSTYLMYVFH